MHYIIFKQDYIKQNQAIISFVKHERGVGSEIDVSKFPQVEEEVSSVGLKTHLCHGTSECLEQHCTCVS